MRLSAKTAGRVRPLVWLFKAIEDLLVPASACEPADTWASVTLEFSTPVPSKKNAMQARFRKGFDKAYTPEVKQAMKDLEIQAKVQWGMRAPVKHPELHFMLTCWTQQDRDGMVTTLLDVLKRARIIEDDRVGDCNGYMLIYPATLSGPGQSSARVRIDFTE